jgi:hypothetical protein
MPCYSGGIIGSPASRRLLREAIQQFFHAVKTTADGNMPTFALLLVAPLPQFHHTQPRLLIRGHRSVRHVDSPNVNITAAS